MQKGIDCIGVAVVFFCHDGNGNFIMAKRSANSKDEQGCWDCGGGGLEVGESIEHALRREIKEEYNTEVLEYDFLGFREVHRENKGTKTHWVALDFKVLVNREQVKNNEPHKFDDIGWFKLDRLPHPMHSQHQIFFDAYREKLN